MAFNNDGDTEIEYDGRRGSINSVRFWNTLDFFNIRYARGEIPSCITERRIDYHPDGIITPIDSTKKQVLCEPHGYWQGTSHEKLLRFMEENRRLGYLLPIIVSGIKPPENPSDQTYGNVPSPDFYRYSSSLGFKAKCVVFTCKSCNIGFVDADVKSVVCEKCHRNSSLEGAYLYWKGWATWVMLRHQNSLRLVPANVYASEKFECAEAIRKTNSTKILSEKLNIKNRWNDNEGDPDATKIFWRRDERVLEMERDLSFIEYNDLLPLAISSRKMSRASSSGTVAEPDPIVPQISPPNPIVPQISQIQRQVVIEGDLDGIAKRWRVNGDEILMEIEFVLDDSKYCFRGDPAERDRIISDALCFAKCNVHTKLTLTYRSAGHKQLMVGQHVVVSNRVIPDSREVTQKKTKYSIDTIDSQKIVVARHDQTKLHTIGVTREQFEFFAKVIEPFPEKTQLSIKEIFDRMNLSSGFTDDKNHRKSHAIFGVMEAYIGNFKSHRRGGRYFYERISNRNVFEDLFVFWNKRVSCSETEAFVSQQNECAR